MHKKNTVMLLFFWKIVTFKKKALIAIKYRPHIDAKLGQFCKWSGTQFESDAASMPDQTNSVQTIGKYFLWSVDFLFFLPQRRYFLRFSV